MITFILLVTAFCLGYSAAALTVKVDCRRAYMAELRKRNR